MSRVYVVAQSAVYRHDIMGVYQTVEDAMRGAMWAADQETYYGRGPDGHHEYEVLELELGQPKRCPEILFTVARDERRPGAPSTKELFLWKPYRGAGNKVRRLYRDGESSDE